MKVDAVGLMTDGTKWYPIIFKDSPLPGGVSIPRRMKSMGHHTQGFLTKEAAEECILQDKLLKDASILRCDLLWRKSYKNYFC